MKEIINRLKTDIKESSGTSPSFLQDLSLYMKACETLAHNAKKFGEAFPNACNMITGTELAEMADEFLTD